MLCLLPAIAGAGGLASWQEGRGIKDGATRDYFNAAAKLPWRHRMGDWVDANGVSQGETPLAEAQSMDGTTLSFDLTDVVSGWHREPATNQGLLLKGLRGGASLILHSREAATAALRPSLQIETDRGSVNLAPSADTYLDKSTYKSLGTRRELRLAGSKSHALMRFDLGTLAPARIIRRATLQLHVAKRFGKAPLRVGAFRAAPDHGHRPKVPTAGIATETPLDAGLAAHPDVLYVSGFDDNGWLDVMRDKQGRYARVDADDTVAGFAPLHGDALQVTIPKGQHLGLNASYHFAEQHGEEPEEIYFRYYLRLGEDWRTAVGGKLPGIAGTYNVAGWGGRAANGKNGWSARGLFAATIVDADRRKRTPIGSYVYHPDAKSRYGSQWHWSNGQYGVLSNNRWYCIEHYVKLNTPGERDGVLRGWVDGRLAFERDDVRFRDTPELKIERVWLNVYHGGTAVARQDAPLFIDNLVIARRYIGPLLRVDEQGRPAMDWWSQVR